MPSSYSPFEIGKFFRIRPPGSAPSSDGRIDLVMERGAFGSGEHETTADCLEVLEGLPDMEGVDVLDLGSGTGILALGALKLGARSALCVDINPKAVETARRNSELNGVADRVDHHVGSISGVHRKDFDLALANIYGDLLIDLAEDLNARVRQDGRLLLSGILWDYNFDVRLRYEACGCTILKNRMLKEFSTVLLRRK